MEDTEMGDPKASPWKTVLSQSERKAERQKEKEREEKEKEQTEKDAESTTTPKKTNNEEQPPTNIPGIIDTASKLLEKHLKITVRPTTKQEQEESRE